MTKKELKDIILKTLEKEGGAAGLKALAKAAKTSKNKLKKDLDDMSGVKQHQDGDYISTPINERETAPASMHSNDGECRCKCPAGYGTETMGFSNFQYGGGSYSASDCEAACNSVPCYELGGSTTTTSTHGLGKGDLGIEPIKRPSKPIRKPRPKQQMASSRCNNDSDCRGTAICVNGICLENPKPDVPRDSRLYNGKIMRLREEEE